MAKCEFSPSRYGEVHCNMTAAMKQLASEVGEIFSLSDLREMLCHCNGENPKETRSQCPAYKDISVHGRNSLWVK